MDNVPVQMLLNRKKKSRLWWWISGDGGATGGDEALRITDLCQAAGTAGDGFLSSNRKRPSENGYGLYGHPEGIRPPFRHVDVF